MEQLFKINKRRCSTCKNIYELNKVNFSQSKKKRLNGFGRNCRKCQILVFQEMKQKYNSSYGYKRNKTVEAFGRKCNACGLKSSIKGFFDIDHIIPVGRDKNKRLIKNDNMKNLQILCPNCHRLKTIEDKKKYKWGKGIKLKVK